MTLRIAGKPLCKNGIKSRRYSMLEVQTQVIMTFCRNERADRFFQIFSPVDHPITPYDLEGELYDSH